MAARKPLVLNAGQIEQLQSGDTLDAPVSEVDVIARTNDEASTVNAGMPVYAFDADGVKRAQANAAGTARVLGLMKSDTAAGVNGLVQTDGVFTLADWTNVIGSANLTTGSVYYLSSSSPGQLTATAPASGYIVEIGQAISTTEIELSIRQPIKL